MDQILTDDRPEHRPRMEVNSVDLAFADPPFNIDSDVYHANRAREDHVQWTDRRLAAMQTDLPNDKPPTEDAP